MEPQELEWDNAEEHLQLGHSPPSDDQTLENILQPRILFNVDSQSASLTQESSDDNVFFANDHSTSKRSTKLKRQNAMKRKHHCKSEPRMTREMLRKSHEGSISMPTSPSQVELNRTQNLENILRRNHPVVPEAVSMDNGVVQNLQDALTLTDAAPLQTTGLRKKQRINYLMLHKSGRKN